MLYLTACGYRRIADDRRGHGDDDQIVPIADSALLSAISPVCGRRRICPQARW
jgi:hypothetical protein